MSSTDSSSTVPSWVTDVFRIVVGALVVVLGVSEFLTYEQSVQFLAALQIPAAETLVLLVGAVEIVVAGSMFPNRGVQCAALSITTIITVAIVTAGPTWQNIGVLLAAIVLIGVNATP